MNKVIVSILIFISVFLVACKTNQIEAQPLSQTPTAAVAGLPEPTQPETEEEHKTAAEALKELEEQQITTSTNGKTSLYPPAPADLTGEDALKARTRSLFTQSTAPSQEIDADKDFGPRYDNKNDLPEGYGNSGSAGE